jgi:protein kinase-like protein
MALQPGSRVGAYEVVALVGQGGMGEVYRARDTRLKREVALKVLPSEVAHDPDRILRFQREGELLAALNHPNIAAIFGLEQSNPSADSQSAICAIVMELVEGQTLADRTRAVERRADGNRGSLGASVAPPFSVSSTGVLVFRTAAGTDVSRLVWFDRQGKQGEQLGPAAEYGDVFLSPDGKMVVVRRTDPQTGRPHLWSVDLNRGVFSRLNVGPRSKWRLQSRPMAGWPSRPT